MGTSYNPPIVKNGLVLNVDPANIKSYPAASDSNRANVSLLLDFDGANGSTTFVDKSLNNLTVTANGNAQISTAQSKFGGSAGYFDGNGDYLTVATATPFAFGTGDFTIEFWAYFNDITGIQGFADAAQSTTASTPSNWLIYKNSSSKIEFGFHWGTAPSVVSTSSPSQATWMHIAVSRSGTSLRLFINGVLEATTTNSLNITAQQLQVGLVATPYWFNGYIDDFRITKGFARYTSNFTPPGRLLEAPGRIYDLSKNKITATLTNGPVYSSSNAGKLTFDGTDDFINVGALSGSFSSFTVFVWFRPTNVSSYKNVIDCNFSYNGTTGNIGPRLEMDNSGNLGWIYSNVTNNNDLYYAHAVRSSGLPANSWHCAAITYNGTSNASVTYYNGLNTGIARTGGIGGSATGFIGVMNNVIIGKGFHLAAATQRSLVGDCSVIQIYNRDLTASEILQNYTATKGRFGL